MGGTSKSTQQSQTAPWAPAQSALQGILGQINPASAAPTAPESDALNSIQANAYASKNYGPQAMGLATDMMSGGGILNDAYANYQKQLNPIANQNNDPTQAPGMAELLATIRGDVGNSINSQFAGAGRDLSGINQQSVARGISQGEAAPLLGQYNQNVQNQMGAAGNLFGAGQSTQQQVFGNQAQGLDVALNGVPAAQNNQANQILQAQAQARGLPIQNLGMLAGLTIPIAGLGSQSSGSGTMTDSGMRQFQQFGSGMGGLFGGQGAGAAGNASGMLGRAFNFFGGR